MTAAGSDCDDTAEQIVAIVDRLGASDRLAAIDFLKKLKTGHFDGWSDGHMKGWLTKRRRYRREMTARASMAN